MRRTALGLFLALSAIVGCTPAPTPGSSSPSVAAALVNETTKGEIAALFQRRMEALSRRDPSGYQKTFEVTRLALRRCLSDAFEVASRQGVPAAPDVSKVEQYGDYVRAYVDEGFGYRRLYFRRVDGGWIQTEPMDAELRGEKTKTVDGLEFQYWGIDEDVIDVMAKSSIEARTVVLRNGPKVSTPAD